MWAWALRRPTVFERVEVPRPGPERPAPGQVLLRSLAGGICGSDGPYFRGAPSPYAAPEPGFTGPPGSPLHEVVGEVVTSADARLGPGDLVVGWAIGFDGLADYVVTEADSLAPYDPGLTPEQAVLLQPLACVIHAVDRIGDIRGRRVAVLGLGPIGLLFTRLLADRGAARVTGVDPIDRSDVAGTFGVDDLVGATGAQWAAGLADEDRPEVVVEAVGHQVATLQDALSAVHDEGQVFYFGVHDDPVYPIDMEKMVRKHLTLRAGGTLHRRDRLGEADRYLRRNPDLLALLTHSFGRDRIQEAYDLATRPEVGRLKVTLRLGS